MAVLNLFQRAFHLAHYIFPSGGTCLEFGVYTGGTYCYQAEKIRDTYTSSSLFGFDSWAGLPDERGGVWYPSRHAKGNFTASKQMVLNQLAARNLDPHDKRFRLIDGFFSDSLTASLRATIRDVIFVNIDVDLYQSTMEILDFVRPLLRPGVVIYWDDWKDPKDKNPKPWGEHRAWFEWYPAHQSLEVETLEINPVNQRTMLVSRVGEERIQEPLPSIEDIRYEALRLTSRTEAEGSDRDYERFLQFKRRVGRIALLRPLVRGLKMILR